MACPALAVLAAPSFQACVPGIALGETADSRRSTTGLACLDEL